jgi:hypothetical protein
MSNAVQSEINCIKWGNRWITKEQESEYKQKQKDKVPMEPKTADEIKKELIDKVVIKILRQISKKIDNFTDKDLTNMLKLLPSLLDQQTTTDASVNIKNTILDHLNSLEEDEE